MLLLLLLLPPPMFFFHLRHVGRVLTDTYLLATDDINPCISKRHRCDPRSSYCNITGEHSYSCPCKDGFIDVSGNCTGTVAGV